MKNVYTYKIHEDQRSNYFSLKAKSSYILKKSYFISRVKLASKTYHLFSAGQKRNQTKQCQANKPSQTSPLRILEKCCDLRMRGGEASTTTGFILRLPFS